MTTDSAEPHVWLVCGAANESAPGNAIIGLRLTPSLCEQLAELQQVAASLAAKYPAFIAMSYEVACLHRWPATDQTDIFDESVAWHRQVPGFTPPREALLVVQEQVSFDEEGCVFSGYLADDADDRRIESQYLPSTLLTTVRGQLQLALPRS